MDGPKTEKKEFVSAFVTNTRLMGVIGMYIHWKLPEDRNNEDLHQFFYFDAEEYGFENYQEILGDDKEELAKIRGSLIGGLGGMQVSITLKEACYLLNWYTEFNKKNNLEMPEGIDDYKFLFGYNRNLSEPERYILMKKQCVEIETKYELINYFIMRCFGRDFTAASYLASKALVLDIFPEFSAATLCLNTIDEAEEHGTYINESLLEFDEEYYITVTKTHIQGKTIVGFERISSFKISASEAAMKLARPEFVSVYEILGDIEISRASTALMMDSMITDHDSGQLFMIFNPNNKHVAKKQYRLNEDVLGMYFNTTSNQLLVAAYSMDEIRRLEKDLSYSNIAKNLVPLSKYEFKEPVLYEFINSNFEDFDDFVDAIKNS